MCLEACARSRTAGFSIGQPLLASFLEWLPVSPAWAARHPCGW